MNSMSEKIMTRSGVELVVEREDRDNLPLVEFRLKTSKRCLLHWALASIPQGAWRIPPQSSWPEGSRVFGDGAVQTPFSRADGEGRIRILLKGIRDVPLLAFVLFYPDEGRWDNNQGQNYSISLRKTEGSPQETPGGEVRGVAAAGDDPLGDPVLSSVALEIVKNETGRNSWALMHRFNFAFELLDRVRGKADGLALIFVWLRFSALRQLDWQRNYNTKPRELSHAMERLVQKLNQDYFSDPGKRELIRLILTTLGRGGEGQRIRDEILEIMHRHHLQEVSGQFMEEWHQKMHNNTSPDDIGICEAYLEFLRSNGNLGRFYQKLQEVGITRKRLESFERPVRTLPDFIPSLKDALIRDFGHFLKTLKLVHGGADLETAIETARNFVAPDLQDLLSFVWHHREEPPSSLVSLIEKVTEARRRLKKAAGTSHGGPDLLFLDLALENLLRLAVERSRQNLSRDQLVELIFLVLENWLFTREHEELSLCLSHWRRLIDQPRWGPDWALHASAAVERLERSAGGVIDQTCQLIQPQADFLGRAFKAAPETIQIFSEEVVRGTSIFVLSILLHHLLPHLRRTAHFGAWQVISRHPGTGRVEVVATLGSIQGKQFSEPTVIIAGKVQGNEEIPAGVKAVLTSDSIDIVSHLGIRARNNKILLATCYDPEALERVRARAGFFVSLTAKAAGEIRMEGAEAKVHPLQTLSSPRLLKIAPLPSGVYALSARDFREGLVGRKSRNLQGLKGRLPDWVYLPDSVALPFGVFEAVLREGQNRWAADRYAELSARVDEKPADILPVLRDTILALGAPNTLVSSLRRTMEESGLEWPEGWETAWRAIKRVWASKWNERAYWSRRGREIRHEDLFMAVLIQKVVEAEYAFVIHTVNPVSGNREE
ncbi:MAG TPA: PEP/pyruvate-binding domain-containing protein, partial [Thermodesulfobacteriota bacterium]|nr:PEP/pyruvate-binding domain-containing protein [Thermodesulfobacteriota bacterium]